MRKKSPESMAFDRLVGKRLKAARRENFMSQEELADAVSLTYQQIQKYEYGANRMPAYKLVQFAEVLNKSPEYFYKTQEEQAFAVFDRKEQALLNAYRQIESMRIKVGLVAITQAASRVSG